MENQITYAAYGTNISVAQMAVRFPDARVYGRAELRDYELVFRGPSGSAVATVEPREGGTVPVLLWRLSRRDGRALDIYENWPVLREKKILEVQMNSRPYTPRSTSWRRGTRPDGPPSTTATSSQKVTAPAASIRRCWRRRWRAVRREHEHH